jgi:hypothetical protein
MFHLCPHPKQWLGTLFCVCILLANISEERVNPILVFSFWPEAEVPLIAFEYKYMWNLETFRLRMDSLPY